MIGTGKCKDDPAGTSEGSGLKLSDAQGIITIRDILVRKMAALA